MPLQGFAIIKQHTLEISRREAHQRSSLICDLMPGPDISILIAVSIKRCQTRELFAERSDHRILNNTMVKVRFSNKTELLECDNNHREVDNE
jgi:hypothetical protein